MYFYEREPDSIAQPLVPLRERTKYAVVVTRRLKDANGDPVGSPFEYVHHLGQTEALKDLPGYLPHGLTMDDVAFAFSFTTQTVESDFVAVRDGLYGRGVQKHIGEEFPARMKEFYPLVDLEHPNFEDLTSPYLVMGEDFARIYQRIAAAFQGRRDASSNVIEGHLFVDYHAIGTFESPQLYERVDTHGNPLSYNQQIWPQT